MHPFLEIDGCKGTRCTRVAAAPEVAQAQWRRRAARYLSRKRGAEKS